MKVRCKKKSGYYQFLVIPYNLELDNEDVASSEGATSDTGELEYDLTLEHDYTVYGIVVIDGEIRYLLQDDHGYPGFFLVVYLKFYNQAFRWTGKLQNIILEKKQCWLLATLTWLINILT